MIDSDSPHTWQDLQNRVATILRECGVTAEVEKSLATARGSVTVDVWAYDRRATPAQVYLIECKRWRNRVPQQVVHAFRSVVGDSGANWGAIIASNDFQSGAHRAAEYSNVRLLTWQAFQELFVQRWFTEYFLPSVAAGSDALVEYTEPINSRISKKAELLAADRQANFRRLREDHADLARYCLLLGVLACETPPLLRDQDGESTPPRLPLRDTFTGIEPGRNLRISDNILDETTYRGLLDSSLREAQLAIAQFDAVFGERA